MVYLPTFTIIYHKNQPNVGKYTIHGLYGIFTYFIETIFDHSNMFGDSQTKKSC